VVKPASRKKVATYLMEQHRISERSACKLVGISRTAFRYQAIAKDDHKLRVRLLELASKHKALGYLMLHGMLRSEGLVINSKRTYRLYQTEGLQLRRRRKKKLDRPRQPIAVPIAPNIRWSMDFVADQLANGRRFRVLNVKDDYSKELVGQLVAFSITGAMVGRFLDRLIEERSAPDQITCDNGTEFTSKAMFFWQARTKVKLAFIHARKAYAECLCRKPEWQVQRRVPQPTLVQKS